MVRKVGHIGIAVRSLNEALAFYQGQLGLEPTVITDVPSEGVRIAFLPVGDTEIELLEPLGPETTVGKFIERRGPGLHHLSFDVQDVAGEIARLAGTGVPVLDAEPRQGATAKTAFLHPRASGGVLIELSEPEANHGR